jgi:hypothetical protein
VGRLRERRLAFQTVLDRDGERLPDAKRMSGMLYRSLAKEALWAAGRVYDQGRIRQTELARRFLGQTRRNRISMNSWPSPSTAGRS